MIHSRKPLTVRSSLCSYPYSYLRYSYLRSCLWACLAAAVLIAVLGGCSTKTAKGDLAGSGLKKLSVRQYPRFGDSLDFENLTAAIDQSLIYFNRVPATRIFTYGKDRYDAAHMIRTLETFKHFLKTCPGSGELNAFIRSEFLVYKSVGREKGEVLFTGYFEPTYRGSLEPGPNFPWPVYGYPRDLFQIDLSKFSDAYKGHKRLMARVDPASRQVLPYWDREEINRMADFSDRAVPVVWLANRADRFFLEIQGSGRVALDNGEVVRVHYAGANGRPYSSIGKYLIDINAVPREEMSMQAIRQWLEANPARMDEVLHTNESFVFFKPGEGGPFGNIGVAVTPLRSIATDIKVFPRGALCFAETALPAPDSRQPKEAWGRASFFVLNQDTGGAIKGPGRADLFCGNGDWAAYAAGHMTAEGSLYLLVLRPR